VQVAGSVWQAAPAAASVRGGACVFARRGAHACAGKGGNNVSRDPTTGYAPCAKRVCVRRCARRVAQRGKRAGSAVRGRCSKVQEVLRGKARACVCGKVPFSHAAECRVVP